MESGLFWSNRASLYSLDPNRRFFVSFILFSVHKLAITKLNILFSLLEFHLIFRSLEIETTFSRFSRIFFSLHFSFSFHFCSILCRRGIKQWVSHMDVKWWFFNAFRNIQRFTGRWAKIRLVRHNKPTYWKCLFISRNTSIEVRPQNTQHKIIHLHTTYE